MSVELTCLLWSTLLGLAYISVQGATMQKGAKGHVDPNRDRAPVLTERAARADRALRNFLETYPLFVALVLVAELSARHGTLTVYGALLYMLARIVYLPLYISGLAPLRSLSWVFSLVGLVMMFVGILI